MEPVSEKRRCPRAEKRLRVSLEFADGGLMYAVTHDLSESGAFVVMDRHTLPAVGEQVNIKILDHPEDDDLSWSTMQVVRIGSGGVGLVALD